MACSTSPVILTNTRPASGATASAAGHAGSIHSALKCRRPLPTACDVLAFPQVEPQSGNLDLLQGAGRWNVHDCIVDAEAVHRLHHPSAVPSQADPAELYHQYFLLVRGSSRKRLDCAVDDMVERW